MEGGEIMRGGKHIVRGGFGELYDISGTTPDLPRRIPLANGDFENNFRITRLDLFPTATNRSAGQSDDMDDATIFFQLSVTPDGCLPYAGATLDSDSLCLRPEDPAVIAWGTVNGFYNTFSWHEPNVLIDDVYITAWSLGTAGTLQRLHYGIGYYIEFEQVKSSGSEGIVYAYREYQESL